MYKADKNFKCNGVKKVRGQELSKEDEVKMKEFLPKLLKDGLVSLSAGAPKGKKPEAKPEVKVEEVKKESKPLKGKKE